MPRDPKPLIPAAALAAAPGFTLTPSDNNFLDEVDRMLHLALDRLGAVLESIQPPTKYDFPAPHVPRDPDASPFAAPKTFVPDFIPYAREFLRSVKGLQTLCNIWTFMKSMRTPAVPATPAAAAPGESSTGIPPEKEKSLLAESKRLGNLLSAALATLPPKG